MTKIEEIMTAAPVIPVLAFENVDEAVNVSRVLVEEGLKVLEITLRHESALDCIRAVADDLGDRAFVGVGTVMRAEQAQAAKDAGAVFGVSPGLTRTLAEAVTALDWAFLPGVATASEAMAAVEEGFTALKFFPAEASGGTAFLKGVGAVLPQVKFCPTGGITLEKAKDYWALPNVPTLGGSWITSRGRNGAICLNKVRMSAKEVLREAL